VQLFRAVHLERARRPQVSASATKDTPAHNAAFLPHQVCNSMELDPRACLITFCSRMTRRCTRSVKFIPVDSLLRVILYSTCMLCAVQSARVSGHMWPRQRDSTRIMQSNMRQRLHRYSQRYCYMHWSVIHWLIYWMCERRYVN
jgi:hypothetical protein